MLSLFPSILFLAPLSALVLRVALAILFALGAYKHFRGASTGLWYFAALLELLGAVSLAVGLYAQAGALLGFITLIVIIAIPSLRPHPLSTLILMLLMCLSILVTGPGAFAFDLPL